jgi:ribosomal protein uL24
MKKQFSPKWISSKQPRKQRKYRAHAPLHLRQNMLSSHLEKSLRVQYKRRAMPICVGDEVAVTAGEFKKKHGKVSKVNLKSLKIYVEGVSRKKISGQEIQVALDPSNVVITKLKTDDKKRLKVLRRKTAEVQPKEVRETKK